MWDKGKDYAELINSKRWQKLRAWQLSRRPLCEDCMAEGIVEAAREVHHAFPVEAALSRADKERLMFDPGNLVSLCHRCHVERHKRMGSHGKKGNEERNMNKMEIFKRRFLM